MIDLDQFTLGPDHNGGVRHLYSNGDYIGQLEGGAGIEFMAIILELKAARDVIHHVKAWDESVEQGFARTLRPDIARANIIRALNAYEEACK